MLHRLALTSCDLPDATTQYLDGMSVAVGIIDALGQSNGYRRHVEGDTDPRDRLIRALADSASRHIKRRVSKRGLAGVQQHL